MVNNRQSRRQFFRKLGAGLAGTTAGMAVLESSAKNEPEGKPLVTYDLTHTLKLDRSNPKQRRKIYDHSHFVSSLQGVVNRKEPRLYVFLMG